MRGAPWSPKEASGLSERMESTEITEGVFERFGEMMYSSPLQETMWVAMRWRDKRTRVQGDLFHPVLGRRFGAPVSRRDSWAFNVQRSPCKPSCIRYQLQFVSFDFNFMQLFTVNERLSCTTMRHECCWDSDLPWAYCSEMFANQCRQELVFFWTGFHGVSTI